jgi:hypothetical protein
MEKIILSVNERSIEIEVAACENAQYLMQRLYGALKSIGFEPETVEKLIYIQKQSDIEDYIKNQIIAKRESEQPLEVLGMSVSKSKLKELIEVPNIAQIQGIKNEFDLDTQNAFKYLTMADGIVSLKESYEADITEKYTTYVTTPRQIEITKKLTILRDAMNDWMMTTGVTSNSALSEIKGLKAGIPQGRYSIDIAYILNC